MFDLSIYHTINVYKSIGSLRFIPTIKIRKYSYVLTIIIIIGQRIYDEEK